MSILISLDWLKERRACSEGVDWFLKQKESDAVLVLESLIKGDKLDWANWTIVRVMERKQYMAYAIFSAEQVINIYEKKYPDNDKPRKAINAAKVCMKNDTEENRSVANAAANVANDAANAADAAANAAYVATDAAYVAADAAYVAAAAAAYAAYAAANVAYAANAAAFAAYVAANVANAATNAANAAANAAYVTADAANATDAARKEMKIKILNYGIKLLKKGG